jgi:hypothetical protein
MRRIEMTPDHKLVWDTLSREQIDVILIFITAYYNENEVECGVRPFKTALCNNAINAAWYLTPDQYLIWRSISDYQKLAVFTNYYNYEEAYGRELMNEYHTDETVAAADYDYTVFVLHDLFRNMNQLTFKFLTNNN